MPETVPCTSHSLHVTMSGARKSAIRSGNHVELLYGGEVSNLTTYTTGPKIVCSGIVAPTAYIDGDVLPLPPPPYSGLTLEGKAVLFAHTIVRHDTNRDFLYVLGGDGSCGVVSVSRIELVDGAKWEELCTLSVSVEADAIPYRMFAVTDTKLCILGNSDTTQFTVHSYFVDITARTVLNGPPFFRHTWCTAFGEHVMSRVVRSSMYGVLVTEWKLPDINHLTLIKTPFAEAESRPVDTAAGCRTHLCCYNVKENGVYTYDGNVWGVIDYHPPENTYVVLFGHPLGDDVHLFAISVSGVPAIADQVVIRPAENTFEKTYHDIPADWLLGRTAVMF